MLGRGNSIGASEMVNRPGSLEHFCSFGLAQPARRRMTRPASTTVGKYSEGSELCENGMLKRCEDGAWSDIGRCDREVAEAPRSGGGDGDESEEILPRR